MWHFVAVDRARKHLEALERKRQLSKEQAEEDERLALEILRRREFAEREHVQSGVLPDNWDSLTLPKLFKKVQAKARGRDLGMTSRIKRWYGRWSRDVPMAMAPHGNPKAIVLSPRASVLALPSFLAGPMRTYSYRSPQKNTGHLPTVQSNTLPPLSSYDSQHFTEYR
ncbi:hypothetical protein APHAL10511_004184 [Amanita phalloides]|nr:hypothetical protein APHAL10511_004184 [Amanita phalloides]